MEYMLFQPPNKAVVAACPTADHLVASAANSFAVIHDASTDEQVHLLRSTTSNQPLQCLAWSCCGTYLAAGESGNNPTVLVWDVSSGRCAQELKGHRSAVSQLCFSPDGKLLASVGCGADGQLCLWDWHTGSLMCKQKASPDHLSSVVFTEDSSHVLAAGKASLKSWSLSWASPRPNRRKSSSNGASNGDAACSGLSLTARQVNLKQQRQANFVDMRLAPCAPGQPAGSNGVYALTDKGTLLLLRSTGRTVDRSINLQVQEAFGLAATPKQVACACSKGVVRLFASKSLQFKANLPYLSPQAAAPSSEFADARACTFGGGSRADNELMVVYADHQMVLWDIKNLAQIQPVRSFASHTGAIWDVRPFSVSCTAPDSCAEESSQMLSGCTTCGTDGTIRFWDMTQAAGIKKPLCSIFTGLPSEASSSQAQAVASSRVQLRCMRLSQDGSMLAAGDTAGNVHVYDIATLQLLFVQEAHDSDVLCLDFSPPAVPSAPAAASGSGRLSNSSSASKDGKGFAVSGSRDMLVHVYDAHNGFRLVETLDDHQAEVTAVRFTSGGRGLVSCGADHSIIFRVLGSSPGAYSAYGYKQQHKETLAHTLLFDLVVDPLDAYVLTADQGGVMRMWDPASGSVLRSIQPEVGAGQVVRLCMDPGGALAICCHSDGCVRLYDIQTGQLLYRAWGHAAHVAAATLSPDLSSLVSVGGDGCIVVWRLPRSLVEQLQAAAAAVADAQEQAGCQMPSPQLLGRQCAASPVPPSPAGTATPSAQQGEGVLGSRATPGSCVSEGGISSTLKRIQQGKPLVSADKLPRWARSPTAASTAAAHASEGGVGAGGNAQQQQPQRLSKWLAACQPCDTLGQGAVTISDPGAQAAAGCVPPSLGPDAAEPTSSSTSLAAPQQALPWHRGADRVVIRNWLDGSSFNKEAAAVAAAAEAVGKEPEGVSQAEQPLAAAEQQPDLPDKAQPCPAGQGAVVKDLFKSHFSELQQGVRGPKPQEAGEEDDCLTVQQDRQSLSAKFKRERSSLSQLSSPVPDMATLGSVKSPDTAAAAASPRCSVEQSTGLTPQGSKLFRATSAHPPAPAPSPAGCAAAVGAGDAGAAAVEATRAAAKRPCSEEASPREKRWRQGQMKPELAGMMERLQSLQAEFVQQREQQQAARASPVRPNSSLGHATPTRKKLLANRRRSDSSAGCSPVCTTDRPQLLLEQLQPGSCAASPAPATTPPLSPGRVTPTRTTTAAAAAAGKGSTKQPWASPSALGSAKSARRTVRRSPVSSPPPSMGRRQQAAALQGEAPRQQQQQSPGAVFGSRTLARSMQRRRSAAADEPAAPAEATDTAAVLKEEDSTAPAPVPSSPAAAASAAAPSPAAVTGDAASPPLAAAPDNSGLLAALFGDDSPAPSPAASAAGPELGPQRGSSPATSTPGGVQQAASAAEPNAAAQSAPSSAVGTPAGTPRAPNTQARLAQLLFDSSPEVSPEQGPTSARQDSSSRRRSSLSPTRRSLPRLDEVLQQGSRSPSLSEPSESFSPDRPALRSPLASSCSPQQQRGQQSAGRGRASPSGIPSLQASRRQLLEQNGRLDVSSECRVSIGTSIAARSPAKAAALGSPLAQQRSRHSAAPAVQASGATVQLQAAAAAAEGSHRGGEVAARRDSIDLTPVPASGLIYTSNDDTPKVNMCGSLTDSPLPAALPHTQTAAAAVADVPAGLAAVRTKAGVTVTPAGNHQVWPAWGSDGAWEVTPSPEAMELKKLWPGAAVAPQGATAADGQAQQLAGRPCSASSAPGAAHEGDQGLGVSAGGSSLGTSAGGTAVAGEAPVLDSGSSYWVAQNPCYDMTPHGSAGRSSKNLEGFMAGSDAGALLSDTSQASSLLSHPVQGLTRDGTSLTEGGAGSCAGAEAEARKEAGVKGVSRHTSYASASSSPLDLQLPSTPGSACGSSMPGSEPGSVGSSRGGSKRLSSAGGRFSGRGLQSLLGHSPSNSGPDSDCKPGSAAGSMLGLLQRMKLGRSKDRSKSGSSAGGGCMSPQVTGDHGDCGEGRSGAAAPRQHQQQQDWSGCTGGSAVSADDVQVEVSSRSAASVVQTPHSAGQRAGLHAAAAAGGLQREAAPALHAVAEKLNSFRHSVLELQALMQDLQGLRLDEDSTQELNKLLTPPNHGHGDASAGHMDQQQQAGSSCSSNSSLVPAVPLQQRLQQEVLHTINELHATITGMPLHSATGADMSSPTPSTPAWIAAAHGSGGSLQHQLLASSPIRSQHAAGSLRAQAASIGGVQQGGPEGAESDDVCVTRIFNLVMQKLEESGAGLGHAQQSS